MGQVFTRGTIAQGVDLQPAFGTLSHRLISIRLEPAEIGSGISIRRSDTDRSWPVDLDHLTPGHNYTAIGDAEQSVAFVEHLMAVLHAGLISDIRIITDGPEIPLYDGSAMALWRALQEAGCVRSDTPWPALTIRRHVRQSAGNRLLVACPGATRFAYGLEYDHPLMGRQYASTTTLAHFETELAWARTFATADQIKTLYGIDPTPEIESMCSVIYPDHVSDHWPAPNALARHKLVDLLGDLFLCGRPLQGVVVGLRTGHADNHALLAQLLANDREAPGE